MAAFVRTLGLGHAPAAVAGLVYAWSGFAVGHSVHVNVVAGLPFLPLTLLFLERAARAAPLRNVALAGLSFGLQCLGGHPQVALMSAALGVGYALVRLWPPRMSARGLARPAGLIALFVAIGAGISAVYYLPMAELARQSVRPEGGLSHAKAVTNALPLPHLVTAVSPFFFFDASTGAYQGAWNPAEMALYAGLPTLVLAGIALVVATARSAGSVLRRRRPDRLAARPRRRHTAPRTPPLACRSSAAFAHRPATCCSWTPPSPCSRPWGSTHSRTRRARPWLGGPASSWRRPPSSRPPCPSRSRSGEAGWRWRETAGATRTGPRALPRSWPPRRGFPCSGWP